MKRQIAELSQRLEESKKIKNKHVIFFSILYNFLYIFKYYNFKVYNGVDLVDDITGKSVVKWALKVSKILFSKEELKAGVLIPSAKTNRLALDPIRVKILKGFKH